MSDPDLNLLVALDALLTERSVTGAARKLHLSTSAMSRTLSRLRDVTGDPLLAPAGRTLVPTPRAEAMAEEVRALTRRAQTLLRPPPVMSARDLSRTFTLRANEAFVVIHAARLTAAVAEAAPGVQLLFAPKPDKDIQPLRDGSVDLEIGVISGDGHELRAQTLYRDGFIGLARTGHPLLDKAPVTPQAFAACDHVSTSRRSHLTGPIDKALDELGLTRRIKVVVPGFPAALAVVMASDLIGSVPRSFAAEMQATGQAANVVMFDLPIALPDIVVSQIWHPRMDADAGHRWLRGLIFDLFRTHDQP
ncbi:LysR family transcriptional regulator [Asticcacaulis sp. EMRT-3]|uniref:LysR family transcriptional regulator n=1 Tax=Asticcacaulis sp. EMRT-3 TaxID=3040349 RepID=UPI0024AE90DE|nr:LysR family transcriptional regulator [Asticcacaulis sp. EMRT-3]MDI7774595.1 LysR family transcriptional regulator [Asticcacaulis sp. EMRT-3]